MGKKGEGGRVIEMDKVCIYVCEEKAEGERLKGER